MSDGADLEELCVAFFYKSKACLSQFISEIKPEWIDEKYKKLFAVYVEYFNKYGEVASVNIIEEEVDDTERMLNYKSMIESAKTIDIELSDFPNLLYKIKKKQNVKLIGKIKNIDNLCSDIHLLNADIEKISSQISGLYRTHSYKEGTLKDTAKTTWERYIEEEKDPSRIRGIYTRFKEVDRITNGLRAPDLMLVVGESGTGKSIVCMNIALNMWLGKNDIKRYSHDYRFSEDGCNVLYFSIEMDYENMRQRIDSNLAEIEYYHLRDRKLTEDEKDRFKRSCVFQSKYGKQFFVTDMPRGIKMADIKAKYDEISLHFAPDVIVVDHLGLMSPNKPTGQDWLDMGEIAADLHEFNRRNSKITIAAAQANRPSKNGKMMHSTHRVGRSEMIPQNASIILQIENREDEETFTDMILHIVKMRNGEKGKIELYKEFGIMKVIDPDEIM